MSAGRSASVAVTVSTAVVFSAALAVSGDVNCGVWSLTGVTVTRIVCVAEPLAAVARFFDNDFVFVVRMGVGQAVFEVTGAEQKSTRRPQKSKKQSDPLHRRLRR